MKTKEKRFNINFKLTLLAMPCLVMATESTAASQPGFVPDELIVQYRPVGNIQQRKATAGLLRQAQQQILIGEDKRSDGKGDLALLKLSAPIKSAQDLANTLSAIAQDPEVEYAEPNWRVHKLDTTRTQPIEDRYRLKSLPNDPYYRDGQSWGMYGNKTFPSNPYGSQAGEAWINDHKPLNCSDIYIGVIDEGVMKQHPDLKDSIWHNRFDPIDGIDNDGNGYIDDRNGWDFYYNDHTIYDAFEDFHGTHVAGILAAAGNNRVGIAGVCWKAKLISAKFLGPDGGDTVNAIKAIDYITDLKVRHGLNIVATNNSWGGGEYSRAMVDAIKRAEKQNILFVAAAGNDGTDNDTFPLYPASYPNANIISVTALTQDGLKSGDANYGKRSVDIAAPGEGIISTVPNFEGKPDYGYDSGTSMAAPFVTGAVALYAHKHPKASTPHIKYAILKGARATDNFFGLTLTGSRLDILRTLKGNPTRFD
jgi:serine protease